MTPVSCDIQMPGSSDAMFTDKLYGQILKTGHSHFSKPRTSRTSFCVRHYASVVVYETEGFTAKNTDLLSREHLKLLQSSQVIIEIIEIICKLI